VLFKTLPWTPSCNTIWKPKRHVSGGVTGIRQVIKLLLTNNLLTFTCKQ
jgi:hypothetical protein